MSNTFGSTVSSGIQDLSAILSLLGTEQCELHVGSALRGDERGGYLYAAITPVSIFGSLGPAKAALSIMFVNIPFVGARTLQHMGFEAKGAVAAIAMLEGKRYEAENRLLDILDRHHVRSAQHVRVQHPGALDQPIAFPPRSWNLQLLIASLLVACLGVTPYIHFSALHHTSFPALTIFFPFCRVIGGLLCVFPGQLLLQYRIEMILKQRVLFKGINDLLNEQKLKIPTQHIPLWDESHASEVSLFSLKHFLKQRVAGNPETARFMECLKQVLGFRSESSPSPSDIATVLNEYVTNTWAWLALMSALLCGFLMTIVGYIGCFTIVQNSSAPSDTYIWLDLETTLALLRLLIWAFNPPWDDPDGLWLTLECQKTTPLHKTLGTDESSPQSFKMVPETTFWEALTAYSGPVNVKEMKRVHGFRHWYSWIGREAGAETLCIILEEETTDREHWTIMCMMNDDRDLEFHVADIFSTRGHAVRAQSLEQDHALMKAPSEFRTNVFKHYEFILSTKSRDSAPIKVSWPLSEFSVIRPDIPNAGGRDAEQGTPSDARVPEETWKKLETGVQLTLSGGVVTYDQFSSYLEVISGYSTSRDLYQRLSDYLDTYTKLIHEAIRQETDLVDGYNKGWRTYSAGTLSLDSLFSVLNSNLVKRERGKGGKDDIDTVKNVAFQKWKANVLNALSNPLRRVGMAREVERLLASFISRDLTPDDLKNMVLVDLVLVISRLEVLVRMGDKIETIHPYVNIAWKILTLVYQVVITQQERGDKLQKLVEAMANAYSFVEDVEFLAERIKRLDVFLTLVQQTVECSLFIQEYTTNGFSSRAVGNTSVNTDRRIDELSEALLKLKDDIDSGPTKGLTFRKPILSTNELQNVESLARLDVLKKLNPVDMNPSLRPLCLPGTRREILDQITEWLMVPSNPSILWLSGMPGSGKCTIATMISETFRSLGRLGAFLFFDRNDRVSSHPDSVIRTIAHSLALSNIHIASAISTTIQREPAAVNAPLRTQFRNLLLEPLASVEHTIKGPIFIILDGLDECGDPDSRATLLAILSTDFPELPRLFRFLITSRREFDITRQFTSRFGEMNLENDNEFGHTGSISSVHLSPDGTRIASGSWDNTVHIWDTLTGVLVAGPLEGHTKPVTSVNFSPDGTRIASGSLDNTMRIWDALTSALVAGPFEGHTKPITSVQFSPDGARIASGSWDNTVRIWDALTGALVTGPLEGHTDSVTSVHFSPDGTRIVSGSWDSTVRIWDALSGALVAAPLQGHTNYVTSVNFSPDGTHIASGSDDWTVRIWDVKNGELVAEPFRGHTGGITSIDFSPDGACIASGSDDRTARIWDVQTGALVAGPFTGHTGGITSIHFSPDGARIATGSEDTTIRISEIASLPESPLGQFPKLDADTGWILNNAGERMLWVPPWLREGLYLPQNTLVIRARGTTKVDLEHFVHGTEWEKCILV